MGSTEASITNYVVIAATCLAVPQGGVMMMLMLLETFGLTINTIALVLPVDWLLNRMRSTVNVFGEQALDSLPSGVDTHCIISYHCR